MIQGILLRIARVTVGAKIINLIDGINERLTGHRTEIILALESLIYLLELLGVLEGIDPKAVGLIQSALIGALPVTLADKVKAVKGQIETVLPK